MEISWLGHACIRVRTQQTAVVMDPCDRSSGFDMGRPTADVVTVSNADPHHSNVRGVRGNPLALDGPGEYEIKGVQLTGVATYLAPPVEDEPAERNTAFLVGSEDLHLAHLGQLGAPLTADQAEQLSGVDILVVPLGVATLSTEEAARIVRALEPTVVIPVHYAANGDADAEGDDVLKKFISSVGVEANEPTQRLSIQRRGLGDTLRVALLQPRG